MKALGRELWQQVQKDLRGEAKTWWEENDEHLINLAKEELVRVGAFLEVGDTRTAKRVLMGQMSAKEYNAMARGTLSVLQGVAAHRAEVIERLRELSEDAARRIGRVLMGVLLGAIL